MTVYADIWRLPGPSRFVQEAARLARAGQHVLAIVPKYIARNDEYTDALVVSLLTELEESRRVIPNPSQGGIASAIGFEISSGFDEYPTTVPELIVHDDFAGRIVICSAADLDTKHLVDLPRFLSRLDAESRPVPGSQRGTMIFVVSQDLLPPDADSATTARLWYWNRVARWDVAALLASRHSPHAPGDVAGEVRLETIIEMVRWDFQLALELSKDWAGDEPIAVTLAKIPTLDSTPDRLHRTIGRQQPPDSLLNSWDDGLVEAWHGDPGYKPAALPHADDRLDRLLWSAQARVLLPWIEVQRVRIEQIVRRKLGDARLASAAEALSTKYPGVEEDTSAIEIALLARIIAVRLGSTEPRLRSTAAILRDARNKLAHLLPVPPSNLTRMVSECSWLDR